MAWIYLLIAGLFEMGWPIGFKLSQTTPYKYTWLSIAIVSMIAGCYLLYQAQKTLPIGTSYMIWTGIGTVGAFVMGILLFDEPFTIARVFFASLIVTGLVGLKIVS